MSTGIRIADDPRAVTARPVMAKLDKALFTRWRNLAAGEAGDPLQRHRAALATARQLDIEYVIAAEVAKLPTDVLVERIGLVGDPRKATQLGVEAVLGAVPVPALKLSGLREAYEELIATELAGKSERQLHRWRTSRDTAIANVIAIMGEDRAIDALTRDDVLKLRKHLQDNVVRKEIAIDTANKGITRVGKMFRAVNDARMLKLPEVFDHIRIAGDKTKQRIAFPIAFVQSHILAEGMFADLNDEARHLIYLLAEIGLRPSEACALTRETIKLGDDVPHVRIRPDGRQLKTGQSGRDIPLVGVALKVVKLHPDGFPPLPRQCRYAVGIGQQGARGEEAAAEL